MLNNFTQNNESQMKVKFILKLICFLLILPNNFLAQEKSLKEFFKEFTSTFWNIENPGLQSLENLDFAINNSSQISGTMNKYTVGQTALRCFDVFNEIWEEYDDLSIPINFPENIRNKLFSAKEKMSTVYYKRTQAISDLVEYLNYGEEDYAESFKNKMSSAKSYYSQVKENFSLVEKEIEKLGDYYLSENNIINNQSTEMIELMNNDIEYSVYFLTKEGVSIFNTKSKEISLLIECSNNYVISSKENSPNRTKIAFAIIDNFNNTRIYVLDLSTRKYYYLKNNSGIKPVNLIWKDEDNLFINIYTEKYEDGIYKPKYPWTELIDVKNIKVIYSFRPTSGVVLSDYLADENYLVYYSVSTTSSSDYMNDYAIINATTNSQIYVGFEFKSTTKVKFFNKRKLFTWYPITTTNQDRQLLSTEYILDYRYYDNEYNLSSTIFDLKDNPKQLTYYPQIDKIACVIDNELGLNQKIVCIYNTNNNTSTFINNPGEIVSICLSPTGTIVLYYDVGTKFIFIKDLLYDKSYKINYQSAPEEWIEDEHILLRSDIDKTFRLYSLLSKSYMQFDFNDLKNDAIILAYFQQ